MSVSTRGAKLKLFNVLFDVLLDVLEDELLDTTHNMSVRGH